MLRLVHSVLVAAYVALPPLALVAIVWVHRSTRYSRQRARRQIILATLASVLLGMAASAMYWAWAGEVFNSPQILVNCYRAAALICILRLLDSLFIRISRFLFLTGKPGWFRADRVFLAQLLRVALLFSIGLPYMIAAAITYRPKSISPIDGRWFDLGAETITFKSSDGLNLAGLWIAADSRPRGGRREWGTQTAVLCRESFFDSSAYIPLVRAMLADGFNVVTFDFRGQGRSQGRLVTYGALEMRDCLGAVHWIRTEHRRESDRIVGVGVGTACAALLAAAADPGPDGQAVAAIALYGGYDRFENLATAAATDYFVPGLRWLVPRVGVTLASVQTGVNLRAFSPADAALAFAPRPILFIDSRTDWMVRAGLSQNLYDAASAPKTILSANASQMDTLRDPGFAAAAAYFLATAAPMI
jgi:alpha-beta hydrolase superfamily lysophospholipase